MVTKLINVRTWKCRQRWFANLVTTTAHKPFLAGCNKPICFADGVAHALKHLCVVVKWDVEKLYTGGVTISQRVVVTPDSHVIHIQKITMFDALFRRYC